MSATSPSAAPALAPDPAGLFPTGVSVRASAIGASLDALHAAERALVARAVPKRQHEFASGRRLARALLAELGCGDAPLLADAQRAPLWPAGFVGSISHGHGVCVAAVARRGAIAGIGVDVEAADAVHAELWSRVLCANEEAWLRARPAGEQTALAAVFFSAKEAVYKAQFPITAARLGFHDVELELDAAGGAFRARVPGFARPVAGSFALRAPWVLTGLVLRAEELPT